MPTGSTTPAGSIIRPLLYGLLAISLLIGGGFAGYFANKERTDTDKPKHAQMAGNNEQFSDTQTKTMDQPETAPPDLQELAEDRTENNQADPSRDVNGRSNDNDKAAELYEEISPSVARVVVRSGGKGSDPSGFGSGFFVSPDGLLVTNYHVVESASSAMVILDNNARFPVAGVWASAPEADLALLKIETHELPHLELHEGEKPPVGNSVYAIGNPQGLTNTLSQGIVSGHRNLSDDVEMLQITAPISQGSSGGPVVNSNGDVVGVTTAQVEGGQNLNFAVPAGHLQKLLDDKPNEVKPLPGASKAPKDRTRPKPEVELVSMKHFVNAHLQNVDKVWLSISVDDGKTPQDIWEPHSRVEKELQNVVAPLIERTGASVSTNVFTRYDSSVDHVMIKVRRVTVGGRTLCQASVHFKARVESSSLERTLAVPVELWSKTLDPIRWGEDAPHEQARRAAKMFVDRWHEGRQANLEDDE